MLTYTWDIATLTIKTFNGVENVVCGVNWAKIGTDADGNKATYSIATNFSDKLLKTDSEDFITYENLTEEKVIEWISSLVDQSMVDSYIQDQIEIVKTKKQQVPAYQLPWNINNPDFPSYRVLDSGGWISVDDPYGVGFVTTTNGETEKSGDTTSGITT